MTVSEIEILTGLDFDDKIYEKNPLLFNENEEKQKRLNIPEFPERIEVDVPEEMISERRGSRTFRLIEKCPFLFAAAIGKCHGE